MAQQPIFAISEEDLPFGIQLYQTSKNKFAVHYGKQVKINLTRSEATKELGQCIMHALECDGKLID